ncbi:ATP synthase F1 subunit delta [Rhodothermus profundi]|uniref:ATP synthase subunit delta n=1 Tax=Rhodothermus profundi TaxID=633813 RepID=A0A1M6VWM1_9BACT|nr:ATP synthase F1 subunit delta [Rhodothermus profundi]SHK85870.1 ATP synthase F1 subcomplex delta subunit [Rhodothermus profundi]
MQGISHPVARRYARALFEEARARGQAEAIDADVAVLHESFTTSRELARVFESPVIPREKKKKIIETLFAGRLQPLTVRFLELLVEKERESLLPAVVAAYRALQDEEQGIIEAQVRTAFPLDEAGAQPLVAKLERLTGKKIRLRLQQDPSLIGGVVVRVGDTVYDGSVRQQLTALRERLRRSVTLGNGSNQS